MMIAVYAILVILLLYVTKAAIHLIDRKSHLPLPPGPNGLPLIGNLRDLPPHGCKEWEHWLKHKDLYGPISSVRTAGHTIILLNEAQVANDILEKRSARYASRPRMVFGGELAGWERMVTVQANPVLVRAHRKRIHHLLGSTKSIASFYPQQDVEVRRFLLRLLQTPERLVDHIRSQTGAVILKIVYGYNVSPHTEDPLVTLANESTDQFGKANEPGAWLVDSIPFLRHLPSWFPGAGFQTTAREWRHTLDTLADKPYAFVQRQMHQGDFQPSYIARQLDEAGKKLGTQEEHEIKWSAAALYGAGADTTVSALASFFLAMALFPEAQTKAQEELDHVTGNRLPTMEDRDSLPYVDALIKEVLRWNPVTPLAVTHSASEDDVYDGYFIPKGAAVVANAWAFLHDAKIYSDPMSFKPERFLPSDGHIPECDPNNFAFGFGRRICPGRALANSTIFLNVARSLKVFHICKTFRDGKMIEPIVDYQPGIISHPKPFDIAIKARSLEYDTLIRQVEIEHPWEEGDAARL